MRNSEISLVSAQEVRSVVAIMEGMLGTESIEQVLQAGGFSDRWRNGTDAHLPNGEYVRLLEAVARHCNLPLLGAILGDTMRFAELGPVGRYVSAAPTSVEALRRASRALKYHESGSDLKLRLQGDLFQLHYQVPTPRALGSWQQCDGVAALFMNLIRSFEGPGWKPEVMRIAAASGARAEHLKKFFRMDVGHIETGVELIGRLDAMNDGTRGRPSGFVPFTFRDSRNLIKSKPPTSFSETFAIALQNFLKDGVTDLGTISAQLHLDRRTLQRRLRAEGTSFGEMLEAARRQLAESLLVDADFTVDEIAKAVGYTSKQHLIRAFKKWTGVTPGTFRHMSRKV